jgi:hypothetical protein
MTRNQLSLERAQECFAYDPESGQLTHRINRGGRTFAGQLAGSVGKDRYIRVRVDGIKYLVHRVVWLMQTGEWPTGNLDNGSLRDR